MKTKKKIKKTKDLYKAPTELERVKSKLALVNSILDVAFGDSEKMLDDAFETLSYSTGENSDFDLKERIKNLSVLNHAIRQAMVESYENS